LYNGKGYYKDYIMGRDFNDDCIMGRDYNEECLMGRDYNDDCIMRGGCIKRIVLRGFHNNDCIMMII